MTAAKKTTVRKKATRRKVSQKRMPNIIIKEPGASEPMEQSMGSDQSFGLDSAAETPETIALATPEEVESAAFKEKAANLAFMQETLTIHIQDVSEKDAQMMFSVEVNGSPYLFERGKTYENVPRYFVEGLARAKPTHFACEEYVDKNNIRGFKYPAHRGLRFPFSVMEDRNPLGPSWLRHVLAQD